MVQKAVNLTAFKVSFWHYNYPLGFSGDHQQDHQCLCLLLCYSFVLSFIDCILLGIKLLLLLLLLLISLPLVMPSQNSTIIDSCTGYHYWLNIGNKVVWSHLILQDMLNPLRPSDATWRHRSGLTLAQVMACCLTAPSHHLNQCWHIINNV